MVLVDFVFYLKMYINTVPLSLIFFIVIFLYTYTSINDLVIHLIYYFYNQLSCKLHLKLSRCDLQV